MNNRTALVLRIAWAILGRTDTIDAKVTSINKKGEKPPHRGPRSDLILCCVGLTVAIETKHWMTGKGLPEDVVHEFTSELSTREEIEKEITSIKAHANVAIWPQGPAPFISVLLWLLCIAGSVSKYKVGSVYFNLLKYGASFLFPSQYYSQIALALVAGSHFLEALYAWHVLAPMKLSSTAIVTWMGMCFMLGYPATMTVRFLKGYWVEHGGETMAETKKKK